MLIRGGVAIAQQMKKSVKHDPVNFICYGKFELNAIVGYPVITDENITGNSIRCGFPMIKSDNVGVVIMIQILLI